MLRVQFTSSYPKKKEHLLSNVSLYSNNIMQCIDIQPNTHQKTRKDPPVHALISSSKTKTEPLFLVIFIEIQDFSMRS